ncbi:MAG: anti-sigma factor family protein [Flavobacteriales bacterium]
MMITRDNYEVYFIDYIDGTLSVDLRQQVEAFLVAHPDLAAELDGLSDVHFNIPNDHSVEKLDLYKAQAPGEKPAFPPVAKEKHEGLRPIVLPRLKGEALVFDAKASLYQQERSLYWNLLPGYGVRKAKRADLAVLRGAHGAIVLPKLVAPIIIFEHKAALFQKGATVVPMTSVQEGAKVFTLKRAFYYSSAAAAIAALLWMNGPNDPSPASVAENPGRAVQGTTHQNAKDSAGEVAMPANPQTNVHTVRHPHDKATPTQEPYKAPIIESNPFEMEHNDVAQNPNSDSNTQIPEPNTQNPEPRILNPDLGTQSAAAYTTASAKRKSAKEYNGIWDFAEDKAKKALWGGEDYPEQEFTSSWFKKNVNKTSKELDLPVDIESEKDEQRKVFRIRIGRFEYVRYRK